MSRMHRPEVSSRSFVSGAQLTALVLAPVILLTYLFVVSAGAGKVTDFENAFYGAGTAILHGESLYPALSDSELAAGTAYVYTPVTAIAVVPFTLLPVDVAGLLVMALLTAGVAATLYVLGVQDWRCYAVAYAWPPVFSAIQTGNVTIALGFAAALAWRFRNRPAVAGASLGVSLGIKALLWPLLLWLGATRRWAPLAASVGIGALTVAVSWAVIGFAGFAEQPEMVRRLTTLLAPESYTVYALALDVGASAEVARALGIAVAVALLAVVVALANRRDDPRAFALAVVAVLACSPLVWLHYFALLLVVVSLMQPRLGPAWFAPLLMYASTATHNGTTLQTTLTIGAAALTAVLALYAPAKLFATRRDLTWSDPR